MHINLVKEKILIIKILIIKRLQNFYFGAKNTRTSTALGIIWSAAEANKSEILLCAKRKRLLPETEYFWSTQSSKNSGLRNL